MYNHKEWARDFEGFETGLFPQVVMPDSPPPVDLPSHERRAYEPLARERREHRQSGEGDHDSRHA